MGIMSVRLSDETTAQMGRPVRVLGTRELVLTQ